MKRFTALIALLLPLIVGATIPVMGGPRHWTTPSGQAVGSLDFPGGASTSSSGAVRILRNGRTVDVGAAGTNFTVEMWLDADAQNTQSISEGASYNLTNSNIALDSDSNSTRGFIIGLSDGTVCFGVSTAGGSRTICGTTDIRGAGPRHVAAQRNGSTGQVELFVNGTREDSSAGPTGAVNYQSGGSGTDAYHVLAKEKLNATFGFNGRISMMRFSTSLRYSGTTYTVPIAPLTDDANTVGLYFFDENTGTTLGDSSGDGNNGELIGSPAPTWLTSDPF